jgi:hypothetical protein
MAKWYVWLRVFDSHGGTEDYSGIVEAAGPLAAAIKLSEAEYPRARWDKETFNHVSAAILARAMEFEGREDLVEDGKDRDYELIYEAIMALEKKRQTPAWTWLNGDNFVVTVGHTREECEAAFGHAEAECSVQWPRETETVS